MSNDDSYFKRISSNRFAPTEHAVGAWDTNQQHVGPLFGLLTHLVELDATQRRPTDELTITRVSNEIFGVIPLTEFEVAIDVIRPGRTIELVQATVISDERTLAESRYWRLSNYETATVAHTAIPPLSSNTTAIKIPLTDMWPGGYIASIEAHQVVSNGPNHVAAWLHTNTELLDSEPTSNAAAFIGLIDVANALTPPQPVTRWQYPNVELTVHLLRAPMSRTIGLDTNVMMGPTGQGITANVLFDESGHVGFATQALTVRPVSQPNQG